MQKTSNDQNAIFINEVDRLNKLAKMICKKGLQKNGGQKTKVNANTWADMAVKSGIIKYDDCIKIGNLLTLRNTIAHGGADNVRVGANEISAVKNYCKIMNDTANRLKCHVKNDTTTNYSAVAPAKSAKKPSINSIHNKSDYAQNCFDEKHSVKHILLCKNRIKILLSPSYSYDEYTKVITTDTTFFWEDCSDERISIKISNAKTGKTLVDEYTTLNDTKRKSYALPFKESDMENSTVKLDIRLRLMRKKNKTFTRYIPETKGFIRKKTTVREEKYTQKVEYIAAEEKFELTNTLDKRYK